MKLTFVSNKPIFLALFVFMVIGVNSEEVTPVRLTTPSTVKTKTTLHFRLSFNESCDYLAHYCLRAYNTGTLCARTAQYVYHTFKTYCMLDYVNCLERYEVWQIVHMGECFDFPLDTEYGLYHYENDEFLNETYVMEDH
ncbi:uncharacterized protein LOC121737737 [Aricia agestis]|uniref:uncharacterized protein LOC121737737 n=1 Tax=Aricia agestis TaxID=91739 RepID=UPI001C206D18|nr:uncharacterized protein LOC121737737 [Aricia agestis]